MSREGGEADRWDRVRDRALELDPGELRPREVQAFDRALDQLSGEPDVRVGYLANFHPGGLPAWVNLLAARQGIRSAGQIGALGQHVQEVTEDGALAAFEPDVLLLILSLTEWAGERYHRLAEPGGAAEARVLVDELLEHLSGWVEAASSRFSADLLVANFPQAGRPALGIADADRELGETATIREANLRLQRMLAGRDRAHLLDLDSVTAAYGRDRIRDPRLWHLARIPWRDAFLPALADEVVRWLVALLGRTRKCVVVDLDGTLWGGVVGEDGPEGVRLSIGDPVGEAHRAFQRSLKNLQRRGLVLAICSKNNPEDVEELFRSRGDEMLLGEDDFVASRVNWTSKPENLLAIADELNIGTESLIFLDDNPAECRKVEGVLPEVETVLLPEDPAEYAWIVERLVSCEKVRVLDADAGKTEQYRQQRRRRHHREGFEDLNQYLETLETTVRIRAPGAEDLARVHQLFSKTNQFNLTTVRYSPGQIEAFVAEARWTLRIVAVRDRFGELGTVGVYLLDEADEVVLIDSFLLSCRAMGRGIETAMMNDLKERFLAAGDVRCLRGRYVPTAKNRPVEGFLEEQGFHRVEERSGPDEALYGLERDEVEAVPCPWLEVESDR